MSSTPPLPYRIVRQVAGFATRSFYQVRTYGSPPSGDRPMVVIANHPNGGIDPMLVAAAFEQRLHFLAKSSLFDAPGLGAILKAIGALPAFRRQDGSDTSKNASTFEATRSVLTSGGTVCVFPEGTSHADSKLRQLRTGSARIALDAAADGAPVLIVPVGLLYPQRDRFRSEASVFVGDPIDVRQWLTTRGADPDGLDPADPAVVRALTDATTSALRTVTINAEDHELIDLAARLAGATHRTPDGTPDPATQSAWAAALDAAAGTAEGDAVITEIRAFFELLNESGLRPVDLPQLDVLTTAPTLLKDAAATVTLVPAAVFGSVTGGPAFHTTHAISQVVGKQGVGAASIKVGAALVVYPLWGLVVWFLAGRRGPAAMSATSAPKSQSALLRGGLIGAIWITHLASRPIFQSEGDRWRRNLLALRLRRSPALRAKLQASSIELDGLIERLRAAGTSA